MELEFIPNEVLRPVRPCFLLCGLNGEAEWARSLLVDKLSKVFNIIERVQFVPCTKIAKSEKQVKGFNVTNEWMVDFTKRFVLIVELFLLLDGTSDAQLIEDIVFASKYAKEFAYEHIAVVLCVNAPPTSRASVYRNQAKSVVFLPQEQPDIQPLIELIKSMTGSQYKDVLSKKYQKRAGLNMGRFLAPWACRSFYSFKSAMAFEGACETANALREYHASYSAVIEEGNGLEAKGESKKAFCEYSRPTADTILLRMIQCMLKLGSEKEAGAFLRGHLSWFVQGFREAHLLHAWKTVMFCHYGWLMESAGTDGIVHPGVYFSQAIQQALLLLDERAPLCKEALDSLIKVAHSSINHFVSHKQKRHEVLERIDLIKFLCKTGQFSELDVQLAAILSENSSKEWPETLLFVMKIAVNYQPRNLKYIWGYSSIAKDWDFFKRAIDSCDVQEKLEFPEVINSLIDVSVDFDRAACEFGQECAVAMHVSNNSGVGMEIRKVMIEMSDGSSAEYSQSEELLNSSILKVPFRAAKCGEIYIHRAILYVTSPSTALVFNPGSFSTNNHPLRVDQPKALLSIESEHVTGLVNSDNVFATLIIKNLASRPAQGIIKIVKAPADLIISPTFPFGVSGQGVNAVKIPMRSVVAVKGFIHFDIEYDCEEHFCESLTDMILPLTIKEPLEVRTFVERRLKFPDAAKIEDLLEWVVILHILPTIACDALIQVGSHSKQLSLRGEKRVELPFDVGQEKILIDWSGTDGKASGRMALKTPRLSPRPVFGFFFPTFKQVIVVSESDQDEFVVIEVEKKGRIMIQGPKRITCTLQSNSITRFPISYSLIDSSATPSIEVLIDGSSSRPDWLMVPIS